MASVLQVATIKDQGGNANAIEIANSSANVTINNLTSSTGFPAGHVLQVLQTLKTDKDTVTGIPTATANKDSWAYIPSQGGGTSAGDEFQQAITITGSNKVLIITSLKFLISQQNLK